jgi:alkylation response protein AidB-like acyl-CoA dehydrogenase
MGTIKMLFILTDIEPYAGSDVANIQTEAREADDGEHYIVNGEKKWLARHVSFCR